MNPGRTQVMAVTGSSSLSDALATALVGAGELSVRWERELPTIEHRLQSHDFDVGLIAYDAPGGPLDLIRLGSRGDGPPLLLVTDGWDPELEEGALEAGASGCIELRDELEDRRIVRRAVIFADANRRRWQRTRLESLRELGRLLRHESKNVLAAIGGAVQVLAEPGLSSATRRDVGCEIRERLCRYQATLERLVEIVEQGVDAEHCETAWRELLDTAAEPEGQLGGWEK